MPVPDLAVTLHRMVDLIKWPTESQRNHAHETITDHFANPEPSEISKESTTPKQPTKK